MAITEKILNTRVQLKYDTYANWTSQNPILKAGEMAIATVASNDNNKASTGFQNLPNIVIKVGDGTSHYNDLKFVSALAADVHEWAKAPSAPTYSYNQIEGLEQYIRDTANNEIEDTDTQYTIVATDAANYKYELKSKGLKDAAWEKVADLDLSGMLAKITALEGLVGTTAVSDQIATAIESLDAAGATAGQGEIISAVSQEDGFVKATKRALVKADIPTIDQSQVDGLDTALQNAAKAGTDAAATAETNAKQHAEDKIDEAVKALDYADPNYVAGQFVTKVTEEDGVIKVERAAVGIANVTGLQDKLDAMDEEIDSKQDQLTFTSAPNTSDNRVVTEQFILNKLGELNGAMLFKGLVDEVPTGDGDGMYQAGNVVLCGYDEYVFDGNEWLPLGNESIYQTKELATEQHNALQKAIDDGLEALDNEKQDNLTFDGAYSASNPVVTQSAMNDKVKTSIEALDKADAAVAKQFVVAVPEVDGIISVERRALTKDDIPVIEQSQVNGLEKAIEDAAKAGTDAASAAETAAKGYADAEILKAVQALDKADAEVAKNVVTAVSEEDGVISVTRKPLADIAWSGSVNDLVQPEEVILVFDCGSATKNI